MHLSVPPVLIRYSPTVVVLELAVQARVQFDTCSFIGNTAGYDGGAVAIYKGASRRITCCAFNDNAATHAGGAVAVRNGGGKTILLSTTQFSHLCGLANNRLLMLHGA